MAENRVAVVTGANRGMGLETCRQLASRGMRVVLTSRDAAKGAAAAASLADEGITVDHQTLDITDAENVAELAAYVEKTYGRVDVLVNNAGAVLDDEGVDGTETSADVVRASFEVNTLGALSCCHALIPLMKKAGYGRIVNVSSGMGQLTEMNGGYLGYRISKAALNAVTKVLSRDLADTNIKVNSVCPGHVATDMGGAKAPRTIEEGVDTTIWLATLRDDGPTGGFFRDCKQIAW